VSPLRFFSGIRRRLRDADPAFPRTWLHMFVSKVIIGKDNIRICGPKDLLLKESGQWCPLLHEIGAPEEIRTPDPQIRSLGQGVEFSSLSCKPAQNSRITYQWVNPPVANQKPRVPHHFEGGRA